jgi:hypothetical protein
LLRLVERDVEMLRRLADVLADRARQIDAS